jgi:hypothetical protein
VLRETGFVDVRSAIDHRPERIALDDVLAYCSDRHRTSQLFAIPDDAYQAGLERIRRLMREHGTIASELAFVTVWADVPASVCDA